MEETTACFAGKLVFLSFAQDMKTTWKWLASSNDHQQKGDHADPSETSHGGRVRFVDSPRNGEVAPKLPNGQDFFG